MSKMIDKSVILDDRNSILTSLASGAGKSRANVCNNNSFEEKDEGKEEKKPKKDDEEDSENVWEEIQKTTNEMARNISDWFFQNVSFSVSSCSSAYSDSSFSCSYPLVTSSSSSSASSCYSFSSDVASSKKFTLFDMLNSIFPLSMLPKNTHEEDLAKRNLHFEGKSAKVDITTDKMLSMMNAKDIWKDYGELKAKESKNSKTLNYVKDKTNSEKLLNQKTVPSIGVHTQRYVTKSHAYVSINKVKNVGKVVASEILSGDFKIKGPGFCLREIRIPIRQRNKQIIRIRFAVKNFETENSEIFDKNSLCFYECDLPLSVVNSNHFTLEKKVKLLKDKELAELRKKFDYFSEAIFLMSSDESDISELDPHIKLSIKINMQGFIEVIDPEICQSRKVYVSMYDDQVDLKIGEILNKKSDILNNIKIEKLEEPGKYLIENILCSIFFNEKTSVLYVMEGGLIQPFEDYIVNSLDNIQWKGVNDGNCWNRYISKQPLLNVIPNLYSTSSVFDALIDRRKAMELACHRVSLQEDLILKILKKLDNDTPVAMYSKYLIPPCIIISTSVLFSSFASFFSSSFLESKKKCKVAEIFVSYIWDVELKKAKLVCIENENLLKEFDSNTLLNMNNCYLNYLSAFFQNSRGKLYINEGNISKAENYRINNSTNNKNNSFLTHNNIDNNSLSYANKNYTADYLNQSSLINNNMKNYAFNKYSYFFDNRIADDLSLKKIINIQPKSTLNENSFDLKNTINTFNKNYPNNFENVNILNNQNNPSKNTVLFSPNFENTNVNLIDLNFQHVNMQSKKNCARTTLIPKDCRKEEKCDENNKVQKKNFLNEAIEIVSEENDGFNNEESIKKN